MVPKTSPLRNQSSWDFPKEEGTKQFKKLIQNNGIKFLKKKENNFLQ